MRNIFKQIFPEKNENYRKAKNGLRNIKEKFDGFVIAFPDVTPNEIRFVMEKWEDLPKNISNGVKIMALNLIDNYKTLLTSYESNSYIMPHKHSDEYEHGMILKGELVDKFTGVRYKVGDRYQFKPNQIHYLCSTNRGCLVYSTLSVNKEPESLPMTNDIQKIISIL